MIDLDKHHLEFILIYPKSFPFSFSSLIKENPFFSFLAYLC